MAEADVKEQVGEVVSRAKRRLKLEKPDAAEEGGLVGVVRGALRAFGEGDHDRFLDALHQEVSWEAPAGKHFPGSGEHSGRDAVKEKYIGDVGRTYTEFGFRPQSFLDTEEDAVLVIGHFEGNGVEGSKVDTEAVQIWEFNGNAAVRVCIYADSAVFPEVVTERKLEEWKEEEEREKEEGDEDDDKDESDSKSESDEKPKSESDEKPKSEKSDDSDSEERDDSA
jgi:ketosteroid isomerase-like protein